MAPIMPAPPGIVGSRRTPTRVTRGATSLRISSHFAPMPKSKLRNPVMLPPGRARLSTKPLLTGSTTCANTIGIDHRRCRLLRARGERPSRRPADQGDELSPLHELPSDEVHNLAQLDVRAPVHRS